MPDNGASVDWFWGIDVSTFQLSLGIWGSHGGLTWRTETIRPRTGPGQLEWPYYLKSTQSATYALARAARANMEPTVISVEQPVGKVVSPKLTATWGVVLAELVHQFPSTLIWTPKTPEWRKTYGIKNATAKTELVELARRIGYVGEDDNEAEACLIAVAASFSYARR